MPARTAVVYGLLFLLGFVSYVWLWPQAPVQEGDSAQYLEMAADLADGKLDRLHDRTPGYPLLLVLTDSSQEPTRTLFYTSLCLHFLTIWLLAVLLHLSGTGERTLRIFCGLLWLPPYVEPAAHVMTENLAQFTLAAGLVPLALWFSQRRHWLVPLSAAAFGMSALTRPVYQALVPALGVVLVILAILYRRAGIATRDAAAASLALLLGTTLLVGGTAYHNNVKFGYFGLAPTLGFHLSTKTTMLVERLPDEYAVVREILVRARDAELIARGGTHTGTQAVWRARAELEAATGLSTPELSRYLLRMNLELIGRAPVEYLQEVARSMSVYWFPPAGALAAMESSALRWSWALVHVAVVLAFWLEIVVFAGVSLFQASRRVVRREEQPLFSFPAARIQVVCYLLAGTIVGYTMLLSSLLDIGEMRQRRSTDVLIVFMTILGARIWYGAIVRSAEAGTMAQEIRDKG